MLPAAGYSHSAGEGAAAFAISKICWAILDELRCQDWVPRRGRKRVQVASLEARRDTNSGNIREHGSLLVEEAAPDPQSQANLEGLRAQLMDAKVGLGEQQRLVATFYFYDGHTLKDIGKAMNLTEGRISQILKRALGKLRERLKSYPLVSGGGGWQESLG